MHPFGRWLQTRAGSDWLLAERGFVAVLAAGLVGGHALQVGVEETDLAVETPAVSRHILCIDARGLANGPCRAVGDELPIQSESVQLSVSHHGHEAVQEPQRLVAETARVLQPGGLGIYFGVSPGRRGLTVTDPVADSLQRLSSRVLHNTLTQVGLEPIAVHPITPGETGRDRWVRWLDGVHSPWAAQMAGGYVIAARKPEEPARIVNLRMKSRRVDGAVSGSPAGSI